MEKLLSITLCFPAGTFRGLDIAQMIREGIGFEPTYSRLRGIYRLEKPYETTDLKVLEGEGVDFNMALYPEGESNPGRIRFMVAEVAHTHTHQAIYWTIPADLLGQIRPLDQLLMHPDLTVAYCCDEEDEHFQSAAHPSDYRVRGKSVAHLPVYYDDYWAVEKIDISHNPGRKTLISGMWLMSCWRMWFGQGFLARMPAERLLAFPYAHRAEQLPSGCVFVELYADPFAADTLENRTVQQAFRDWVGMEEMG